MSVREKIGREDRKRDGQIQLRILLEILDPDEYVGVWKIETVGDLGQDWLTTNSQEESKGEDEE